MMKEHFRFFDNHSPQLKKKKKAGSLSPPKKIGGYGTHNKSQKVILITLNFFHRWKQDLISSKSQVNLYLQLLMEEEVLAQR